MNEKEKATELEWLKWFYTWADFGPAHSDVLYAMKWRFKNETGKEMPDGYGRDCE